VARRGTVIKGIAPPGAGLPTSDGATTVGAAALIPWGTWLWCAGMAFFAGYCLLVLVVPYYYR
jgi:hypothetical protein